MADRRFTIHPPYLANRGWPKGADADEKIEHLKGSVDSAMQELHRWLRYMTDANDFTQVTLGELLDGEAGEGLTEAETHAKIMIRVSLGF